jgi:hypothetical protein
MFNTLKPENFRNNIYTVSPYLTENTMCLRFTVRRVSAALRKKTNHKKVAIWLWIYGKNKVFES